MWQSTVPRSLYWQVGTGARNGTNITVAPSWSWASIDGLIQKRQRAVNAAQQDAVCAVDVQTEASLGGLIADGQDCKLTVSGYLRRVTTQDNHGERTLLPPVYKDRIDLLIHEGQRQASLKNVSREYSLNSNIQHEVTNAYFLFNTVNRADEDDSYSQLGRLSGLLLHETRPRHVPADRDHGSQRP